MSLFNKWWDAANSLDRSKMAELLDDSFIFIRHNTGEELNKDEFIDLLNQALKIEISKSKDFRLTNTISRNRAEWLLENIDEFFY